MKRLALFLLLVALLHELPAQTTPRTQHQLLEALSKRTGIKIESVEFFRTAPANDAWTAFEFLYSHVPADGHELLKNAGRAIADNTAVERYVTGGITKLPHDYRNAGARGYFLGPLGYVPAPWSLKLIGSYLMDDSRMSGREYAHDDVGTPDNQSIAMFALQEMGFSDAPPESPNGYGIRTLDAWRKWWQANKDRVEERIHEINPGYRPPVAPMPTR